jgi:hypothetical protein
MRKRVTFQRWVAQQQQWQEHGCNSNICCLQVPFLFHIDVAWQRRQQKNSCNNDIYVVNLPLVCFISHHVKHQWTTRPYAWVHDTIILHRVIAKIITTWLQQQHMSLTSPLCAGAQASFCNTLHCAMATTTKQRWQQQRTSVDDKASSMNAQRMRMS